MTIDDKIRDKNLQQYINREAAKVSALSSVKIDKWKCLTCEEILTLNQNQLIEQEIIRNNLVYKTSNKRR